MADANSPKGTSQERKTPSDAKSDTASKGMAERPKGGASGEVTAEDLNDPALHDVTEGMLKEIGQGEKASK